MSKHTPGPWNWQRPISKDLANTLQGSKGLVLRCIDISHDDARLIAAAPDLLEALDWCVAEINRDSPAVINARAAIAKAEGLK